MIKQLLRGCSYPMFLYWDEFPIRKICLILLCFIACTNTRIYAQQKDPSVSLRAKDMSMEQVIVELKKQTGYSFVFNNDLLKNQPKINGQFNNTALRSFLNTIFKNTNLSYDIREKTVVIKRNPESHTGEMKLKTRSLTGVIKDGQGKPVPGATVSSMATMNSVSTNGEGRYALNVPVSSTDQLVVSYVGFKTKNIAYTPSMEPLNIELEEDLKGLDEVAITGFQNIRKELVTGAQTTLDMKDILVPGITSVDKLLEGRVPGMTFMQNSGQVGAAAKLRIRGSSTILGTQEPLWVVDGIVQIDPVNIRAEQINDLDFVNLVGNAISGLNPNDIERIDILKDAAATALYGVRAANGVIVITTKRGKEGPPSINYSVNTSYSMRPRYTDKGVFMMNSKDRVDVSREMIEKQFNFTNVTNFVGYEKAIMDYYNGNIDYATYKAEIDRAESVNTDWFDNVARDAFSVNHTLGLSGGSQLLRYYVSGGYNDEKGNIKNEFNKTYTGNLKFDINYKKFRAAFNLSANRSNRFYNPDDIGAMNYAYSTSRAIPLYNENGSLYYYNKGASALNNDKGTPFNIVNEMNSSGHSIDGTNVNASVNLTYDVLPGLKLNTILSQSFNNTVDKNWYQENTNRMINSKFTASPDGNRAPFGGELNQKNTESRTWNMRFQGDYNKYLDARNKHLFSTTVGAEMSSTSYDNLSQIRRGYYPERGQSFAPIDLTIWTGYAKWLQSSGQPTISESLTNLVGMYLTGTYVYDNRYVFTATARSDYSNGFGSRSNEKFLPTWSVSGRWNAHHDLLQNVKWINLLSLRGSYGIQGNMLNNQTPKITILKGALDTYYNEFGSSVAYFPNPDLKWEKTHSYNAGLDFSFLDNKITGSLAFFYKKTVDAFLSKKVSEINGIGSYAVNQGNIENQGVEISFSFTPVNNLGGNGKRGFMWRIDPQLGQTLSSLINKSINSNGVTLIDENAVTYNDYLSGSMPMAGKPLNTFYSYRFKTLDNTGQPVFYGAEESMINDYKAKYSKMSREEVFLEVMAESGTRVPTLQGGVSNYFGYQNWGLSFNFSYSFGNKIRLLKLASGAYGTNNPIPSQNLRGEFVDRWRYAGDEAFTNIPGIRSSPATNTWWISDATVADFASNIYQMYDDSDLRVVSGDFVKLQSLQLRYNLSTDLCKRWKIKAASLGFAGSNLFTVANKALRGQEPTQSGSTPNINLSVRPNYTLNLNLTL